jgi:hypothetical protein
MMNVEEARKRELARSLVESAKQIEANRQRQRREREDSQREREEAEMLQAQRERLRRLDIEQEASRRVQEYLNKLEQNENTNKIFENTNEIFREKLKAAEALLQQKQGQYLVSYMAAPAKLDSQMDNFAKEWIDQIAKVKDPEMHDKMLSNTSAFLELMRERFKKNIEEKLKKQASESGIPYISPFL